MKKTTPAATDDTTKFKVGQTVYTAHFNPDRPQEKGGPLAEVRRLTIKELYPNYLQKYGPRWVAYQKRPDCGMAYKPDSLFADRADAVNALKAKITRRIASLESLLKSVE